MKLKHIPFLPLIIILFATSLYPTDSLCAVYTVSLNEGGDFRNIQAAINVASDGDTIEVANGTYTGEGNFNIDFLGKAITVKSQNGNSNTIIDCQGKGRAFYFHTNETPTSVLDGFTIINAITKYGGAIRCGEYVSKGEFQQPGRTSNTGSPTIQHCVIKNNYSDYVGAAIACNSSSPVIQDCIITNNRAKWYGGGISARNESSPTIRRSIISNNTAYWGGAIYCYKTATDMVINDCVIKNNRAAYDGGGISLWESFPTISDCVIWGNSSYWGAGITAKNNSGPTIDNSVIAMNYASGFGGAIHSDKSTDITVTSCTIAENFAFAGNNAYTDPSGYPSGGIYVRENSGITVSNTILWDNSLKDAGIYIDARIIASENRNYNNSPEISSSCLTSERVILKDDTLEQSELDSRQYSLDLEQNNYFDKGENIFAHPGFPGDGNYTLPDDSPCKIRNIGVDEDMERKALEENITPRPPAEEDEEFYECFITTLVK